MVSLMRAKALSAAYTCPSSPVCWAFIKRALELTAGFNPIFDDDDYHNTYITNQIGKKKFDEKVEIMLKRGPTIEARRLVE